MPPAEKRHEIIQRIIEMLREERLRQGLSQNQVAKLSGLNHTMILRVEKLERMPTIDTLLRISEALQVDLGQIISKSLK